MADDTHDEPAKSLRELLGPFIGERLVDVTERDADDRDAASPQSEVFLHFGNGGTLHFWIDEVTGFEILGAPEPEGDA